MHLARGRRADAVKVLLRGRFSLRHKTQRADAITLLKEALTLEPTLFDPRLDLTRLLASQGQKAEAMALLEPMVKKVKGGQLRQVRWAMWRVSPSLGAGWRWLRAALTGR